LNQPAAKGSTISKRESLEKVQEYKRKSNPKYVHPELELPELPESVAYLWQWYCEELQTGDRLTWGEIRSWSLLCNKDISATESKALRNLSFIHHRINNTPPK
jgi:hypothetical protein